MSTGRPPVDSVVPCPNHLGDGHVGAPATALRHTPRGWRAPGSRPGHLAAVVLSLSTLCGRSCGRNGRSRGLGAGGGCATPVEVLRRSPTRPRLRGGVVVVLRGDRGPHRRPGPPGARRAQPLGARADRVPVPQPDRGGPGRRWCAQHRHRRRGRTVDGARAPGARSPWSARQRHRRPRCHRQRRRGPDGDRDQDRRRRLERFGLQPEVHLRGLRHRFVEPLRPRRRPGRGRAAGAAYNPLFIYGDAGLGKTHLLQAIAHYVRENYPTFRVRYVSTETFLNEFVDAIRTNTERRPSSAATATVDVLLVDDIQFIEGKEELPGGVLPHLQRPPRGAAARSCSPRTARPTPSPPSRTGCAAGSRWGLITDIQPPDLETRLAILRKKAEREATAVPDEVLEFIATNITDNIRELEGALTRVAAFASLTSEPLAGRAGRAGPRRPPHRAPAPADHARRSILEATSEMFGFTVEELLRQEPPPAARRPPARSPCTSAGSSPTSRFPQIAREFGGRDHTTVIHAVEKIERADEGAAPDLRPGHRADHRWSATAW